MFCICNPGCCRRCSSIAACTAALDLPVSLQQPVAAITASIRPANPIATARILSYLLLFLRTAPSIMTAGSPCASEPDRVISTTE